MLKNYALFSALSIVFMMSVEAQILQGSATLSSSNNMAITVTVNTNTNNVDIEYSGPSSVYYAVGFGGSSMTNTYSIITTGSAAISERRLGNHNSGIALSSSLTSSGTVISGGVRTTSVTRPRVGPTGNHFTFPNTAQSIVLIWAKGNGASLSNHGSSNRGTAMITLTDICNIPPTALPDTTICQGDSVLIFGTFRKMAGLYADTLVTALGCDSILNKQLILTPVDTSVTAFSDSLVANATNATYQWIDCQSNTAISGATNNVFIPTTNGLYKVEVTQNSCSDYSACYGAGPSFGLAEENNLKATVFPNPADEMISIELVSPSKFSVSIKNLIGVEVAKAQFDGSVGTVYIQDLPNGIYLIEVESQGKYSVERFVKN